MNIHIHHPERFYCAVKVTPLIEALLDELPQRGRASAN